MQVVSQVTPDRVLDFFAVQYLFARQPLCPSADLRTRIYPAAGEELEADQEIRLVGRNAIRVVPEGDGVLVFHHVTNSRIFHGNGEPEQLEFDTCFTSGLEHLLLVYPKYTRISDLPAEEDDDRVTLANSLYQAGLLMVKNVPQRKTSLRK